MKKERLAADNWYDVWLPQLSPSAGLVEQAQAATTPKQWAAFAKKYRHEMAERDNARLIALLAALSTRHELRRRLLLRRRKPLPPLRSPPALAGERG